MEPEFSKKQLILGAVGVLLLVGIILLSTSNKTKAPSEALDQNASSTQANTDTNTSSGAASSTATTTASQPTIKPALTYTQAINAYKDRRIQFDATCGVIPLQLNAKNKTTIMLDNRASQPRTVYLDRTAYNLGALGFRLVTLTYPTASLPRTVILDCGTGRNSAKILVQQ